MKWWVRDVAVKFDSAEGEGAASRSPPNKRIYFCRCASPHPFGYAQGRSAQRGIVFLRGPPRVLPPWATLKRAAKQPKINTGSFDCTQDGAALLLAVCFVEIRSD